MGNCLILKERQFLVLLQFLGMRQMGFAKIPWVHFTKCEKRVWLPILSLAGVLVSTEGFYDSVRTKCVHELKSPGLVSWNAIINGYRINGHGEFFLSSMRCGIVGKILIVHRNRAFWVLVIMQGSFKDVMVIFSQIMKDIKQVQAKILVSVSLTC
jgi:hypothetical protein